MTTLPDGWLSTELARIKDDVAKWSRGLRESYNSLPGVEKIPEPKKLTSTVKK